MFPGLPSNATRISMQPIVSATRLAEQRAAHRSLETIQTFQLVLPPHEDRDTARQPQVARRRT